MNRHRRVPLGFGVRATGGLPSFFPNRRYLAPRILPERCFLFGPRTFLLLGSLLRLLLRVAVHLLPIVELLESCLVGLRDWSLRNRRVLALQVFERY